MNTIQKSFQRVQQQQNDFQPKGGQGGSPEKHTSPKKNPFGRPASLRFCNFLHKHFVVEHGAKSRAFFCLNKIHPTLSLHFFTSRLSFAKVAGPNALNGKKYETAIVFVLKKIGCQETRECLHKKVAGSFCSGC